MNIGRMQCRWDEHAKANTHTHTHTHSGTRDTQDGRSLGQGLDAILTHESVTHPPI